MFKKIAIFITLFLSVINSAAALEQRISAIVNDDIITESELNERRKLITLINNLVNLSIEQQEQLRKAALEGLIEEKLVFQQGRKFGLEVAEKDINDSIHHLEQANKMPAGHFSGLLLSRNINIDTFKQKIRSDILKQKLSAEILVRGIVISKDEIDETAINANKNDILFSVKEFVAKDDSEKSYQTIIKLRSQAKDCNSKVKLPQEFSQASWEKKLSELDNNMRTLLNSLKPGQFTAIISKNNKATTYQVCERKILGLTEKENDFLANYLGRKKLSYRMQRFLEMIRKQAYIKVL